MLIGCRGIGLIGTLMHHGFFRLWPPHGGGGDAIACQDSLEIFSGWL